MATVTFRKPLSPQDLGVCLTELLKYVLYTNNQTPLPCDLLIRHAGPPEGCASGGTRTGRSSGSSWREKKVQGKTRKLREVLCALQHACLEAGSQVLEAVIILGATIVSPRVLYRVVIDESLVKADTPPLAADNLRRYVVRSLVSNVLETCDTKLSPTNCFVLLLAPRSTGNLGGHVLPRTTFKVVQRGRQVCLWFHSKDTSSPSTTGGSGCREMHQPKDNKDTSCELKKPRHKVQPPVKEEIRDDLELVDLLSELQLTGQKADSSHHRDEYIWFQLSTPFHGFKELPSTFTTTHTKAECRESIWA